MNVLNHNTLQFSSPSDDKNPVDIDVSLEFLDSRSMGRGIWLSAQPANQKGMESRFFAWPDCREQAREWINERVYTHNIYSMGNFAPESAVKVPGGRPSAKDITVVRGMMVDIDLQKGLTFDAARRLIDESLNDLEGDPWLSIMDAGPSCIVDTGGGAQLHWWFQEPLPAAEFGDAVVAQARGFEERFDSDHVHDLCRLDRVPGTLNHASSDKMEANEGRPAVAPTRLLNLSNNRHSLNSLLSVAEPIEGRDAVSTADIDIDFDQVEKCIGNIDELPEHLIEKVRDLNERYDDVSINSAPGADNSGSGRDYHVGAVAVREHGITDPTEILMVMRAVSPETETESTKSKSYYHSTIANILDRNWPNPDPHDYFVKQSKGSGRARKSNPIKLLTIDEIENLKEPAWLVRRHLPENSLSFLYGAPGSYKSFVALDLALHIGFHMPDWHSDRITASGTVVYIAGEGAHGMRDRISAWKRAQLFLPERETSFRLIQRSVDFTQKDQIVFLKEAIRDEAVDDLRLIVIDTVSRAIPGADENSQKDMTPFVSACEDLQQEFHTAVLGVHHADKQGKQMRGSTVLLGAADAVFRADKKSDMAVVLTCEKQKDAPDGWVDTYQMQKIDLGKDKQGEEVSSLAPRRCEKVELTEIGENVGQRIGEAFVRVLDGRTEVLFRDIRDDLRVHFERLGPISPQKDDSKFWKQLEGPVTDSLEVEVSGQRWRLGARKTGFAKSSPWRITAEKLESNSEGSDV